MAVVNKTDSIRFPRARLKIYKISLHPFLMPLRPKRNSKASVKRTQKAPRAQHELGDFIANLGMNVRVARNMNRHKIPPPKRRAADWPRIGLTSFSRSAAFKIARTKKSPHRPTALSMKRVTYQFFDPIGFYGAGESFYGFVNPFGRFHRV